MVTPRLSPLHRKLVRDLVHMRGQAIAIALIVASAVSMYVTMRGAYESMLRAQQTYYGQYRFAEVFANAKRAPESLVRRIRAIPGVAAVSTRIVANVTLDVPTLGEPATARILSIPPPGGLNGVHLIRGRHPAPGAGDEILCSQTFLEENGLGLGATVSAIINGRWRKLRVTGIASSPDNIHEMTDGAFIDHAHFAILWMPRRELEAALGMDGAFNDLSLTLAPGANEADVIVRVDRLLERYGGFGAYGRDDHPSHRVIRDELQQDRVTALFIPAIFMGVAVFLLHLVLSRLVASQRDQIAVLKAFGYGDATIARHFIELTLLIVLAGAVAGIPIGMWLGSGLAAMYGRFFKFPELSFHISPASVAISVGASLAAGAFAAFSAARRAAALPPAEGMRGEAPPRYRRGILDRLGLQRMVSTPVRMIARSMERRPLRTLMSVAGLSMASTILVVGQFSFDALEFMIDVQFRAAQHDDATVVLYNPRASAAITSLRGLPGVRRVEPFRTVPVRLRHGHRQRRIALNGLQRDGQLRLLVDQHRDVTPVPARGLILTAKLAEILEVEPGQRVMVEALEGSRPRAEMMVAGTIDEMFGTNAYMAREELNRFMREGEVISGAYLSHDAAQAGPLYRTLKKTPAVSTVALRELSLKIVRETIIENIVISAAMIVVFACVIAFGVIYNGARIALSERGRDLASLRVLGFGSGEVGLMLAGEQAVLTAASIPLGFLAGWLLSAWVAAMFDSEVYRIPVVISGRTFGVSFLIVAFAAVATALVVQRRVRKLDLVEVLKTRE
jgi:putative ABC transport system permease protein